MKKVFNISVPTAKKSSKSGLFGAFTRYFWYTRWRYNAEKGVVSMSYEAIFFEKSDLQKFEMFRTLTVHHSDGLSISDLATKLHLSYQQSYNIFQELLRDLVDLTDDTRAVCKKALNGTTPLKISLDDYRTYLLQDAIAFQFIDYLVQGNRPSLDRFCAERYISRSTLMRKTIPVRNFLADFHLKLSLTKTAFVGDEKQVRLFLQRILIRLWPPKSACSGPFVARAYSMATTSSWIPLLPAPSAITRSRPSIFIKKRPSQG